MIKKGSTRTVLVLNKIVIKFPTLSNYKLFIIGVLGNLIEKQLYNNNPREDLGEVLYGSKTGLFLIMRKYKILSNDISWSELQDYIHNKYQYDNLKEVMISDIKPSNWGMNGNNLVLVDYGKQI